MLALRGTCPARLADPVAREAWKGARLSAGALAALASALVFAHPAN